MERHICPHCSGEALYTSALRGETHCRSCGVRFTLSKYTNAKPTAFVSFVKSVRRHAPRLRTSRTLVYTASLLVGSTVVWLIASAVGFIPDEVRLVNRRFVSMADQNRISAALVMLVTGVPTTDGDIDFLAAGTGCVVSNDGFVLTNRHVVAPTALGARVWLYQGGERYDAHLVRSASVADLALIRCDRYFPYRFRLRTTPYSGPVNVDAVALGFQEMPVDTRLIETRWASTRGTIARVFQDDAGTRWIEHSAPLGHGSSGGPLLVDDLLIGVNARSADSMSLAIDVGSVAEWVYQTMKESKRVAG